MQSLRIVLLLAGLFGASAQAPTTAPTAAPTSAPTVASIDETTTAEVTTTPQSAPDATTTPVTTSAAVSSTSVADVADVANGTTAEPVVMMSKISFLLTITTNATCADMTAESELHTAMLKVGAALAGGVPTDAVEVGCVDARRLRAGRRLGAMSLAFEVTVPTADAAKTQNALAAVTLESATAIFESVATSYSFAVDAASLSAMQASITTVEHGNETNSTNATTTDSPSIETGAAAPEKSCFLGAMLTGLFVLASM